MFKDLKVGDRVTRFLGGTIPMKMVVVGVISICGSETDRIICALASEEPRIIGLDEPTWEFDPVTGAEIDDDLGWGRFQTGSFITRDHNASS